jgi:hypothetical protein
MDLQTNDDGVVSFLPVLNWGVFVVQDKTIGLAVDYFASAEDAAAQKMTRVQLHLEPGPAAELARALISRSNAVLERPGGG